MNSIPTEQATSIHKSSLFNKIRTLSSEKRSSQPDARLNMNKIPPANNASFVKSIISARSSGSRPRLRPSGAEVTENSYRATNQSSVLTTNRGATPLTERVSVVRKDSSNILNKTQSSTTNLNNSMAKPSGRGEASLKERPPLAQKKQQVSVVKVSNNLGYVNKTTEPLVVTKKTITAVKTMLSEFDELSRLFQEDCEGNNMEIFNKLQNIFATAQKAESYAIGFKALELYFTISNLYKNLPKTIQLIKLYKSMTTIFHDYNRKIDSYKWLALVYQEHQKTDLAIMYLKKMLRLALAVGNKDKELVAYDLLGIQYYYLGNLEVASYFHQKMALGETEPDNSPQRNVAKGHLASTIAGRTFEDTINREEVYKVYVSSGDEEITIPIESQRSSNTKSTASLAQNNLDDKVKLLPAVKVGHGRSQSQRMRSQERLRPQKGDDVDEQKKKLINVNEFARDLVKKRQQAIGSTQMNMPVRIHHMSTNRIAENLHHLQHSAANFQEDVIHGRYLDGYAKLKIESLVKKFKDNLDKYLSELSKVISEDDSKPMNNDDDDEKILG